MKKEEAVQGFRALMQEINHLTCMEEEMMWDIPAKNTRIRGETTMNKTELIAAMAETSGLSKKDCDAALAAFITTVGTALKSGEKVQLIGFGSFEVKERAARTGRNPRTKETVEIPASKAPVFKAGQAFKDAIR